MQTAESMSPIVSEQSFKDESIPEGEGSQEEEIQASGESQQIEEEQHEGEAQEEEEIVPKQRKKLNSAQARINKLRRENYQMQHQAQEASRQAEMLRQENERLKALSETTNQASMIHYNESVKLREQSAKAQLGKAIENGDVNLQIEATEELASAKAEAKNLEAWRAQEKMRMDSMQQQQQPQPRPQEEYYQQPPQEQYNQETVDWLQSNPWMHPDHEDFDPDLQEEVISYAAALDKRLARTGQQNKIMSKEYYDNINRYINGDNQASRTLNMKQSTIPVSGVGKSATQVRSQNKGSIVLTAEQKEFADLMRIPHTEYAKQVLVDRQIQAQKGRPY